VTVLSHNTLENKISLVLVPLLASAGLRVLKLICADEPSGQALLDNLVSIPGIDLPSNPADVDKRIARTGGAYAPIPESIVLDDTSSLLSDLDEITRFELHSLFTLYAVDWDGISIDIRVGDYTSPIKARQAQKLAMGLKVHCEAMRTGFSFFIGYQNQPLGHALGTVLELQEALAVLKAKGPLDLTKLALEHGADLLIHAGKFIDRTRAKSCLKKQLQNGSALERFKDIIQVNKGTAEVTGELYPFSLSKRVLRIVSHKKGFIHRIAMDRLFDLKRRLCSEHKGAGLLLLKKIGDTTEKNGPLAEAYLPSSWDAQLVQAEVQDIFSISQYPPEFLPLIAEKIKGSFRF
jgi:pyrimidine-nucleoside phosphorylase